MFGKENDYRTIQVAKGEVLLREGQPLTKLLIVKSGEIACVTLSHDRLVPVYNVTDSGVIGEDGVFSDNRPSSYSAVALTDSSVVEIPKQDIMKFINASSDWVKNILFDISDKVAKTTEIIAEHRIIDDRFTNGKMFTDEEEVMIKKSLSPSEKTRD